MIGQSLPAAFPQHMGDAVRLQRMEAFEIQERLRIAARGRVSRHDGDEVHPDRLPDLARAGEGLVDELPRRHGRKVGRGELLGEEIGKGVLEARVAEHGGVKIAREHRFGDGNGLDFFAEGEPDIVHSRICLRHISTIVILRCPCPEGRGLPSASLNGYIPRTSD